MLKTAKAHSCHLRPHMNPHGIILFAAIFYLKLYSCSAALHHYKLDTKHPTPQIAVCVVGAVRSLVDKPVYESMEETYLGDHVDMFFHLFTGRELSRRGQMELVKKDARKLQAALKTATGIQLQSTENGYICDAVATGRFFKVQECARMVQDYAKIHNKSYDSFVITRPDILYKRPHEAPIAAVLQRGCYADGCWTPTESGEFEYGDYQQGIQLALNLTKARCCGPQDTDCFFEKVEGQKANYVFHQHFKEHSLPTCHKCRHKGLPIPYILVRSANQYEYLKREYHVGFDTKKLHNTVKPDVTMNDHPTISKNSLWKTMTETKQREFIQIHLLKTKKDNGKQ